MPDVARTALRAPVQMPGVADPGTDPRPDLDVEQVAQVDRRPGGAQLPEAEEVDLVVHPHRRGVPCAEPFPHRVVVPSRHDRRLGRARRGELDRPGQAETDPPHVPGGAADPGEQFVERRLDLGQHRLRPPGDVDVAVPHGQHGAHQVGHPGRVAGGAEFGGEDASRVPAEAERARLPPPGRRIEVALLQQTRVEQGRDALGDRGPAEAGPGAQLGAGVGGPAADQVEQARGALHQLGTRLVHHGPPLCSLPQMISRDERTSVRGGR